MGFQAKNLQKLKALRTAPFRRPATRSAAATLAAMMNFIQVLSAEIIVSKLLFPLLTSHHVPGLNLPCLVPLPRIQARLSPNFKRKIGVF